MFQEIVAPLDGSELAEGILRPVGRLLHSEDATVVLLRAVPRPGGESPRERPELLDAARAYLARVEAKVAAEGARVRSVLLEGDPAEAIVRYALEARPSLLAMATHGRSGPARWIRGSVAERVLRTAPVPLLLAPPEALGEEGSAAPFRKLLVPLDGSARAAAVLPLAEGIAGLYGSEVVLLRVGWETPPPGDAGYPPVVTTSLVLGEEELRESLEPARSRLAAAGLSVRTEVRLGLEATEILEVARAEAVDLLVMTSHGRTGLDRWVFGSIAEKVLRHCPVPVLVQRVAAFPAEDAVPFAPLPTEGEA